jgi:hypothetical protein
MHAPREDTSQDTILWLYDSTIATPPHDYQRQNWADDAPVELHDADREVAVLEVIVAMLLELHAPVSDHLRQHTPPVPIGFTCSVRLQSPSYLLQMRIQS